MKIALQTNKDIIDFVMLDIPKIGQASKLPSFATDAQEARWMELERQKDYKAVDNAGNIWLIKNPVSWKWRPTYGFPNMRTYFRPKPRLGMYFGDAIKLIRGDEKKSNRRAVTAPPVKDPQGGLGVAKGKPQLALLDDSRGYKRKEDPEVLPPESSDVDDINF